MSLAQAAPLRSKYKQRSGHSPALYAVFTIVMTCGWPLDHRR